MLFAIAVVALTACGAGDDTVVATPLPSPVPAQSLVTITFDAGDGTPAQEWTLTCEPPGGTHPQPEAACAALADLDPTVFDPVPPDQACTMIFGGPETATIRGTWNGAEIDASFSQQNGCEIARWEAISGVLATGYGATG